MKNELLATEGGNQVIKKHLPIQKSIGTEEIKEAKLIMNWLDKNKPTKYKHSLIHNDYKYDNVVFSSNSWSKIN